MEMPICPDCNSESFERVLEETFTMRAEYVDGKLEITEVGGETYDSHVRCAACKFTNFDEPAEIEELFW
jgi:hypothetical protein